MAISGGDGSIILTTSVDTSGISRGSNSIKTMLQGVGNSAKATGAKIQSAFASFKGQRETFKALTQAIKDQQYVINSLNKEYAELVVKGKQNSTEAKKLKENINELEAEMRELQYSAKAVGTTSGTALSKLGAGLKKIASYLLGIHLIFSFINFSKEAGQLASTAEASVQRLIDIYGKASIAVGDFIDQNAHALGMSRAAAAEFSAVYGNLFSVWADQETNAKLTTQYLNATAVVASKTGRTMEDVQERIRSGLLGNTEAVEDLGIFVNIKTIEMTEAFQRVAQGAKWDSLTASQQSQVRTLAILEQATKKYGTEVANTTALTREQYNAAFQDFQATWGQVVNLVLMPILRIATRILNTLTAGLRVIAGLSGKTIDSNKVIENQSDNIGSAIGGAVDNQKALTDAVKDTAKEQKKLLAGFDDLEILSQNALSGGSGAGAGGVGGVSGIEGLNVIGSEIDEAEYTSKLALIGMVTGWALVGLGIILMFSGHPFIGIGMVASGFVLSAGAAEGGTELGKKEKQKLINIGTITGVALIGLGVLLLFTSFWKLGLGMVASGATAVYTALALGKFSQDIKKKVTDILLITGTVMLVLGTILLFVPGFEKFGIAMLAAGAAEIITAAIMNAEQIKQWISENLWVLVAEAGKFLFVVGIMLLFVPGMMNWGLAAMVAGLAIVGLSAIVPNWNEIKTTIMQFFTDNWEAIASVSLVLVVLGIILCFAHQWLIGIGLIATGAVGLYTTVVPNWDEIKEKISEFFKNNWEAIATVSTVLVILGIILCFAQQWLIGIGLIATGATGLYTTVVPNWDELKGKIRTFFQNNWEAITAISAALVVLGVILCIASLWGIGLTMIGIGAAGLYGVTAANWDGIKTTISKFVTENYNAIVGWSAALLVLGVVLLFIPGCLGVGLTLIGLSATAIWGASKINSSALSSKLTTELDKVNASAKAGVNKINTTLSGINSPTGGNLHAGKFTLPKNGYARGTVVPPNRPHLAWFGDNKQEPEIVSPVSTMKQAFTEAMIEMGGNFGGGNTEVVLEIDGREFGRAVVEQGNRENRRIGTRLVMA